MASRDNPSGASNDELHGEVSNGCERKTYGFRNELAFFHLSEFYCAYGDPEHCMSRPMTKRSNSGTKPKRPAELLKGWKEIAGYLGEPASVVKRWAAEGMPVSTQGRFVATSPAELNAWLSRESGKPVRVVTPEADLTSELERGVAFFGGNKKRPAR
jgi:hypothetical protein